MSLDTSSPGSYRDMKAISDWLSHTVQSRLTTATDDVSSIYSSSTTHWSSFSGESYRSVLGMTTSAGDDVTQLAADVAEKISSFAGQIERLEGHLVQHRADAIAAGIAVDGPIILEPTNPLPYCPNDHTDPRWPEWQEFQDRVRLYEEMSTDVGTRLADLQVWCEEHLVAFLAGIEPTPATELMGFLEDSSAGIAQTVLDGGIERWQQDVDAAALSGAHAQYLHEQALQRLKSGNPAVRTAAREVLEAGLNRGGGALVDAANDAARFLRHAPVIGWVLDPLLTGVGIAQGQDAIAAGVEVTAGAVGGAAVAAGLALFGAPPVAVVLVAGGAAILVGAGAVWAYEEIVPQDVREAIDAGFRDFMADGWDLFVETAGDPSNVSY